MATIIENKTSANIATAWIALTLFAVSFNCFHYQIDRQEPDIYLHTLLSLQQWKSEIYSHPLYFSLLKIASGFSRDSETVNLAATFLLSILVVVRYFVILFFLRVFMIKSGTVSRKPWLFAILSGAFCVIHALAFNKERMMLGLFSPTNWHNSTTILQLPFALFLFFHLFRQSTLISPKNILLLSIGFALSNLAKPNFFLCYAPVYLLNAWTICGRQWNRKYFLMLVPICAGTFVIIMELLFTYNFSSGKGIGIDPFRIWNYFSANIGSAFLFSFAYPLAYLLLYFRRVSGDIMLLSAWLLALLALIIFILFFEEGPRMYHANFIWQTTPAMLILFLATFINWCNSLPAPRTGFRWKDLFITLLFIMHVCSGLVYLYKVTRFGFW